MDKDKKVKTDELNELKNKVEELEKRVRKLEGSVIVAEDDVLLPKAIEIVKSYDRVSPALLQRNLIIGYARAARLIDQLEQKGIIGPAERAKPRKVILKK